MADRMANLIMRTLSIWLVLMLTMLALPGLAQGVTGVTVQGHTAAGDSQAADTGGPGESADIAGAIKQAAESGVTVVIIDSNGNLIGTSGSPAEPKPVAAPATVNRSSVLMKTQAEITEFRETLRARLEALPNSINEVTYILRATSPEGEIMTYVKILGWSVLLLIPAWFATSRIYGRRLVRNFVVSRVLEDPQGYREKMPFLVFRFLMGVGGTVFMLVLAYVAGLFVFEHTGDLSVQFTITAIFTGVFIARTVSDVWRMILSPFLPQYRIPVLSDRDARKLYYWAATLAFYNIATIMFSTWIHDFGLNYNVYAILYGSMSLFGALLNILMILFNGRAVTNAIRGGKRPEDVSWLTRVISYAWAPVLIFYAVFGWFELAFDLVMEQRESIPLIAGAYGVFLSIIVVYGVINYLIERYFDRTIARDRINQDMAAADAAEDAKELPPPPQPTITTYEQLARRVAGILAFVAGAYALLRIWDPDNSVMEDSFAGRSLDVITILFIGYIVYHFFRIWIDSKIAEESVEETEEEMSDEGPLTGASRLATLLPLFRGAILAVVVVSIGLIALLEMGINVSPLFAGAGVVGLAVGFGAQTLVRDIFSGAFFLIDDAFRKGEYIDIGLVKGTVEKISVRSFQLRHHLGALNTIPFGEIKVLTNYSRDWVIMKLPLRVTYDTDVDKVRKLIKNLGQKLLEDPVIGDNFIQPLKSQGVIEMQDSAMIIRVKFMTKPGDQFLVRKRVYEDIRELFAREGIHFAHREVTVRLADGHVEDLSHNEREAVAAAARSVIEEEDFDDMGQAAEDR